MRNDNPYLEQVHQALPRILGMFDTNPASGTYGLGDRFRWGWKLIDFTNAKFQGAAHGLAILIQHDLLPEYLSRDAALSAIEAMFEGLTGIIEKNGSVCEAFPYEYSYGLTGFVANDMLSAILALDGVISDESRGRYIAAVRPMMGFLQYADEAHGVICNHLAGVVAAFYKWNKLTGEKFPKSAALLSRIETHLSDEGWFLEYEGADPGYQSLCTGYLADIYMLSSDETVKDMLERSLEFLAYFAHPDGSFGGVYGARNTRFLAPGAVEALADEFPVAAALAVFSRRSVAEMRFVTLASVDAHNMAPFFNSYCKAAAQYDDARTVNAVLPCHQPEPFRKHFPDAGLLIDSGDEHYTVISTHKGGVVYHFAGETAHIDTGVLLQGPAGRKVSTQGYHTGNACVIDGDTVSIGSDFTAVNNTLPSPFQFFVLRFLNMSVMRSRMIGNAIKTLIVRLLITRKRGSGATNKRTITLGRDIVVHDAQSGVQGYERVQVKRAFSAIHMASQGYWQRQDTAND